jgi:hypothetical protein
MKPRSRTDADSEMARAAGDATNKETPAAGPPPTNDTHDATHV